MSEPRRAAVLGRPIEHSLSPVLHRAAYAALGLDGWRYEAIDVGESELPAFFDSLDESWAGLSLTMPLKHAAVPLLDHIEPLAKLLGVVNTVLVQHSRSGTRPILVGANTDVHGIVEAFRGSGLSDATLPDATSPTAALPRVAILGGGATAASAMAALAQLGHTSPEVYVRSLGRSGALVRAASKMGITPQWRKFERAVECAEADLVVSTITAAGAADLAASLRSKGLRGSGRLLDVVYEPWPSPLGLLWGDRAIAGTEMLVHQAVEQVRLMTGADAPIEAMRDALNRALAARGASTG